MRKGFFNICIPYKLNIPYSKNNVETKYEEMIININFIRSIEFYSDNSEYGTEYQITFVDGDTQLIYGKDYDRLMDYLFNVNHKKQIKTSNKTEEVEPPTEKQIKWAIDISKKKVIPLPNLDDKNEVWKFINDNIKEQ